MENLKVGRAVSSLDEPSTVMVTEVDEEGELLNDKEESILVPGPTTTVNINTGPSPADVSSRSHAAVEDAEFTVGEQTPDFPHSFFPCSRDNSPSGKHAVLPTKKVSPEKPRAIVTQDFSQETLSSLSLGDEFDVNKIPVNNTSETESPETFSQPETETTVHKRKHSQHEFVHENKKARIENCPAKSINDYKRIMNFIKNQYIPVFPPLNFFGFNFKASYKLELENVSDMPAFVNNALKSGFLDGSQARTNEYCTLDNVNISDVAEQSNTESFQENEELFSLVSSPVIISSDDSVANTEQNDSNSTSKEVNIRNETVDSLRNEKIKLINQDFQQNQNCRESFSRTNSQYSDISDNEEETNTTLHTISTEKQTENVTGCHVDRPPPRFHYEKVNYNIDAKRKTFQNPKKGKQRRKRSSKKSGINAMLVSDADIPPEIDKPAPDNSIIDVGPLSKAIEQGLMFDENFRRSFASAVYNILDQIEPVKPTPTNEIKEADTTKLPNFSNIDPDFLKYSQKDESKSPGREKADHEEIKQKLKLHLKKKSESQSCAVSTDKQIKTEVPDPYFDRVSEEEDPDATLWYGFDGPCGKIVNVEEADD